MAKTKLIIKPTFKTAEEKQEYLELQMKEMNKKYGMDVIHCGDEEKSIEKISTGIPELDDLLGGGIARGRFTVFWGSSKSGKSSSAYYLTATSQRAGLKVYYIALEPFDKERAELFGVDLSPECKNKIIIGKFPIAEQSLDSITDFARKELVDVIILDSIHSLSPKREQEEKSGEKKSLEKENMALLASKLSQWFRTANDPIQRSKVAVLLIGQTRTNIGGFVALDQLSGGNSLLHYSRLIAHFRRGKGSDAPTKKEKITKIIMNEDDEEITHTVTEERIVGFNCVIKLDKVQIQGAKQELSEINLPYFFASGFDKPKEKEVVTVTEAIKLYEEVKEKATEAINKITKPKKQRGRPKGIK